MTTDSVTITDHDEIRPWVGARDGGTSRFQKLIRRH
jgi:hypothetical protein